MCLTVNTKRFLWANTQRDTVSRMTLGVRIREARVAQGLSQAELAARCGWKNGQGRIGNYERDEREPSLSDIQRLADCTDVRFEWLLTGNEPKLNGTERPNVANTSPGPEITQYLPLISWVRAGEWAEVENPHEPGQYERLIPVTRRYSNRAFALRIDGDSMQAPGGDSFPDGSIITVEPTQQAKNGSYVVIRLESSDEATFKQLVIDGHRRFLKPLNPRYPITEITKSAVICGVVRQLVMDFDR